MTACPCCGNDVTGVDREITMGMPDELFAMPDTERERRVRAGGKSFLVLDGSRHFVRALLPVRLDIGHEFRFGVWLEISATDHRRLQGVWDNASYMRTRLDGTLVNAVPPWGASVLGARCRASARGQEDALYIDASPDAGLARVLTHPWAAHECEELIAEVWGDG